MPGRIDRLGPRLAPLTRLAWGMVLIPLLAFQSRWYLTLILVAIFALLAGRAGKRISFPFFASMVASVTVFNLLSPFGRVLLSWGPFTLTQGALEDGLNKGLVISGLVFVSLFSVSRELRFGGRLGDLLARTFYYYEQLMTERKNLRLRTLVLSVDRMLERLFDPSGDHELPAPPVPRRTRPSGWLLVGATVLAAAALLAAGFVLPSLY
jgi:hypothetical protein